MRSKQFFVNLGMVLALGAMLLSVPALATGVEDPETPEQSQAGEVEDENNQEPAPDDNTSIGGGLNTDTVEQPPASNAQPSTPNISQTLPQPNDPDTETKQPASTTPTAPATKPTSPAKAPKPQASSKPSSTTTIAPAAPTTADADSEASQVVTIIPTAPNDNIAPTEIETPHTGLVETQSVPANPFAIILLILAGITILAAGIVSTLLSKAAQRNRTAI